jgi:hypothetical protein
MLLTKTATPIAITTANAPAISIPVQRYIPKVWDENGKSEPMTRVVVMIGDMEFFRDCDDAECDYLNGNGIEVIRAIPLNYQDDETLEF